MNGGKKLLGLLLVVIVIVTMTQVDNLLPAATLARTARTLGKLRTLHTCQNVAPVPSFLGELTGKLDLRCGEAGERFDPPLLEPSAEPQDDGTYRWDECRMVVYLPIDDGETATETVRLDPDDWQKAAQDFPGIWCAYAWPTGDSESIETTFFLHHSGEILRCVPQGAGPVYEGDAAPAADAAFTGTPGDIEGTPAYDRVGNDGNLWKLVAAP